MRFGAIRDTLKDVKVAIEKLELRLFIKLGSLVIVSIGALATLIKLS